MFCDQVISYVYLRSVFSYPLSPQVKIATVNLLRQEFVADNFFDKSEWSKSYGENPKIGWVFNQLFLLPTRLQNLNS